MGILSKILDFALTGSWEEYKRVQFYREMPESIRNNKKAEGEKEE
jgi:hypothetical protein